MKVERQERSAKGIRFSIRGVGGELARAYLYVMTNDLHAAPFGLLEDVYVDGSQRGNGLGHAIGGQRLQGLQQNGNREEHGRHCHRPARGNREHERKGKIGKEMLQEPMQSEPHLPRRRDERRDDDRREQHHPGEAGQT